MKAWQAGLRIAPAYGAALDHEQLDDARRIADEPALQSDNDKLFAKWELPPRNLTTNDFNPLRPCTLAGVKSAAQRAA